MNENANDILQENATHSQTNNSQPVEEYYVEVDEPVNNSNQRATTIQAIANKSQNGHGVIGML